MNMKSEQHWAAFKWFLSDNDLQRSCSAVPVYSADSCVATVMCVFMKEREPLPSSGLFLFSLFLGFYITVSSNQAAPGSVNNMRGTGRTHTHHTRLPKMANSHPPRVLGEIRDSGSSVLSLHLYSYKIRPQYTLRSKVNQQLYQIEAFP